jgi:arsenite/tail-anchored protein-transporting ATPase
MPSVLNGPLAATTPATGPSVVPWLDTATRFLFFTGKGGVGKTTVASATAVSLAEAGQRVLIVSTDPASNLDDVFTMQAGPEPAAVPGAPGLWVANLDPVTAAASYRQHMVAPYRGVLPEAAVRSMEEQLSGACTVEIAAFNEFTALLADPSLIARFDHVVFDTAPTGHTLRLLSLASAWKGFLTTSSAGASCLGPLAGLEQNRARYAATVEALADADRTTVLLVSRAESSALQEAARAASELTALGVSSLRLIVNGVLPDRGLDAQEDAIAITYAARQRQALDQMPPALRGLPQVELPLVASELTGVDALRAFSEAARIGGAVPNGAEYVSAPAGQQSGAPSGFGSFDLLIEQIIADGPGVVMVMGKGGVGKTSIAAALARALADRGHQVHVSTTDPAAHLAAAVGEDRPATLTVSRIDPAEEIRRYTAEVIGAAEASAAEVGGLDADERALLEEDLRSPCTEEIAVFQAFARTVAEAAEGPDTYVVLDTAPTGHTLLLLDATESYHREVSRTQHSQIPDAVRALLPRLRDPRYTRMLLVTLPESTPVHEAERLQADLRRAGIEPFGWVVNASLAASGTGHPLLAARAAIEASHIRRVRDELSSRAWLIPWEARTR